MRVLLFLACLFLCILATAASAERRVALLIGNAAYPNAQLANPLHDIALLKKTFEDAGFDKVEAYPDLNRRDMWRVINDFEILANGADAAVIFYSGHGMEIAGINYMIPVDARLQRESDVKSEAIPLDDAIQVLRGARKLQLVLLDACRDNPFRSKMSGATRGGSKGLALFNVPDDSNLLVVYAAEPGRTALDAAPGSEGNSPFTLALAKNLTEPDSEVRLAIGAVRDEVFAASGRAQKPFNMGSLGKEKIFLGPHGQPELARDYEAARNIGSRAAWEDFLNIYRADNFYTRNARKELEKFPAEPPRPKPSVAPQPVAPQPVALPRPSEPAPSSRDCPLELEPPSVDRNGVGRFAVNDRCGKLDAISIDYAGRTFTFQADSRTRAEFSFDFYAGPQPVTIRTADQRMAPFAPPPFSQMSLAKAVVIWQGPVDLDLHAFEDGAEPGGAGHVWRGQPRSLRGGGYLTQTGATAIDGQHVQVYTLRNAGGVVSVAFRVNQSRCAPEAPRVGFTMERYQNGLLQKTGQSGARPKQCGQLLGGDKEAWAPRAADLALSIPF